MVMSAILKNKDRRSYIVFKRLLYKEPDSFVCSDYTVYRKNSSFNVSMKTFEINYLAAEAYFCLSPPVSFWPGLRISCDRQLNERKF